VTILIYVHGTVYKIQSFLPFGPRILLAAHKIIKNWKDQEWKKFNIHQILKLSKKLSFNPQVTLAIQENCQVVEGMGATTTNSFCSP
jgi:hypothetical protein